MDNPDRVTNYLGHMASNVDAGSGARPIPLMSRQPYWDVPPHDSPRDRAMIRRPREPQDRPRYEPVIQPPVDRDGGDQGRHDQAANHDPPGFETAYTSSNAKNVTVHLEAELFVDLGDELEWLNRLMRLGDFTSALAFFDSHLKRHIDRPSVFVQYAALLLEMDDYKSIAALDKTTPIDFREADGGDDDDEWQTLENEWKAIRAVALYFVQPRKEPVTRNVSPVLDEILPVSGRLSTTGVRILCLGLFLEERTLFLSQFDSQGRRRKNDPTDWANWTEIYRQLLAQGRVWDFHDLFMVLLSIFPTNEVLKAFFGELDHRVAISQMVESWNTESTEPDEGTQLALLDILSTIIILSPRRQQFDLAERGLMLADVIAASLTRLFPGNTNSRPWLHYAMAKASFITYRDNPDFRISGNLKGPGLTHWMTTNFWGYRTLPYYIPLRNEIPEVPVPKVPLQQARALEMILRSAENRKDYRLQAACLEEMIFQSEEPSALFDRLAELQKSTRNETCSLIANLARYHLCKSERDKSRLYGDLLEFGVWDDPGELSSATNFAARDIIQRALSRRESSDPRDTLMVAVRYQAYLTTRLRNLLQQYFPASFSSRDTDDHSSTRSVVPPSSPKPRTFHSHPNTATAQPQQAPIIINNIIKNYDTDTSDSDTDSDNRSRDDGHGRWTNQNSYRNTFRPRGRTNARSPSPVRVQSVSDDEEQTRKEFLKDLAARNASIKQGNSSDLVVRNNRNRDNGITETDFKNATPQVAQPPAVIINHTNHRRGNAPPVAEESSHLHPDGNLRINVNNMYSTPGNRSQGIDKGRVFSTTEEPSAEHTAGQESRESYKYRKRARSYSPIPPRQPSEKGYDASTNNRITNWLEDSNGK